MMGQSEIQLEKSAPYFPVVELDQAVDHYREVLGFTADYLFGDPVEFAIMSRDGQTIMLKRVSGVEILPNEAQGGTWDVFFWVRGLEALAAELSGAGADIVYGPVVKEEYGMNEFAVRDLSGYVLGFGESIDG